MDFNLKKLGHFQLCLVITGLMMVCFPRDNSIEMFVLLSQEHFVYDGSYMVMILTQF